MRVIAKKRCRAMFEPPEKGERATLNPNLSTRLNLLFSDQALGRLDDCWSRSASVPRAIFNAKTLKLYGKIKFARSAGGLRDQLRRKPLAKTVNQLEQHYKYYVCNLGIRPDTRRMVFASRTGSRDIVHDSYLCIAV